MDDGRGGQFTSQVGHNSPYLMLTYTTKNIVLKSRTYRFRYRAQNCHGWGTFSPELYVLAATNP